MNNHTDTTTVTIDGIPGQECLTDYEKNVLKAAGINPEELSAKDLEIIKLRLPDHADLLQKVKGFLAGEENEIENLLEGDGKHTHHKKKKMDPVTGLKSSNTNNSDVGEDPDDGDDDDDRDPPVLLEMKPIVYAGHTDEMPTKADKTPDMYATNNDNETTTDSDELKPRSRADAIRRYNSAVGSERNWVDLIIEEKDKKHPPKVKFANSY